MRISPLCMRESTSASTSLTSESSGSNKKSMTQPTAAMPTAGTISPARRASRERGMRCVARRSSQTTAPAEKPATAAPRKPAEVTGAPGVSSVTKVPLYRHAPSSASQPPRNPVTNPGMPASARAMKPANTGNIRSNAVLPMKFKNEVIGKLRPQSAKGLLDWKNVSRIYDSAIRKPPTVTNGIIAETPAINTSNRRLATRLRPCGTPVGSVEFGRRRALSGVWYSGRSPPIARSNSSCGCRMPSVTGTRSSGFPSKRSRSTWRSAATMMAVQCWISSSVSAFSTPPAPSASTFSETPRYAAALRRDSAAMCVCAMPIGQAVTARSCGCGSGAGIFSRCRLACASSSSAQNATGVSACRSLSHSGRSSRSSDNRESTCMCRSAAFSGQRIKKNR